MRAMREGEEMLNFTVGPVMSSESVRAIGAENVPYFRTAEFSAIMLENEALMKKFANSGEDSRVIFLTGSGTASLEAMIINLFDERDKVLVVDGGSFGHRLVELLELYKIEHTIIVPPQGKSIGKEELAPYEGQGYTGFLVNLHETSVGILYDIDLISDFCQRNHIFLLVDAISAFLTDPIDMQRSKIGVMCTGSQKALACPPGVSIVILSKEALDRLEQYPVRCMYLDFRDALKNGERGQTPFTPAVGTLLQIHQRLLEIEAAGGVAEENRRSKELAEYFRGRLKEENLPFEIASEDMANAMTPLHPTTASANDIFLILKDEYGIWVCPNGGALKDKLFRVGHMGALGRAEYDALIDAFKDLQRRGII